MPDETVLLISIVVSVVYTIILYGVGPLVFAILRKKPVTKRKVKWFSVLYSISAWLCSNAFWHLYTGASVSPGGAALLWGWIFYKMLKNRLSKTNRLIETISAVPTSRYQTQETEMGKFVVDSETGEVTREELPEPKPSSTDIAEGLDEKKNLLKSILEQKERMQAQQKEHLKTLSEYLPVEDAYQFYQNGQLSESDFQSYKDAREVLEYHVSVFPSMMQSTDLMIEQLQSEIKELEKQEQKTQQKKSDPRNDDLVTSVPSVQSKEPDMPKNRWYKVAIVSLSAVCAVLAIFVFLLGYSGNSARAEYEQMEERIEELTEENTSLSKQVSQMGERLDEVIEPYYFLQESIGFIVDGSRRYHNYNCSIFQDADEYWAHNIEYCEYLGYSRCPDCW